MGWLRWVPSALVLLPWLLGPLAPSNEIRTRDASSAFAFRLLDWETVNLGQRTSRLWQGLVEPIAASDADAQTLRTYFRPRSQRPNLRPLAEPAMERVVAGAYAAEGVTRSEPVNLGHLFPPVLVALTAPPNVLVVSPRTSIQVADSVVLQAMDVPAQEQLEASVDSQGVSSLVAPIGGLATYPSMVLEEDSPERVLSSIAHEWLHQYLIFYPLGAGYWRSQETREINETTADLLGQEIGGKIVTQYNLRRSAPDASQTPSPAPDGGFDFRTFMRETRQRTDALLAEGSVDQAEAYMRQRRDVLQQYGYGIRKLNQAYFALYGSYGDGYAASPTNPIPDLLRQLRARSGSLAEFLFTVRNVTSIAELRAAAQA